MARQVSIVPHTHWDREWYAPFQRFRLRLVDLLDDLLARLDADPSYRHFLLDGQMAVVDDYLEVRPHEADRIARLNRTGRLAMGPWYTLPDEFLVSGETLVRNLRAGLDRAAHFGGAMAVGYLPDMFGHVAQMPQILRSFGFEHAVVWRGVPAAVTETAFAWTAPDGSTVRAEYLPGGYGNGSRLPGDADQLVALIDGFVHRHDVDTVGPVLWMNGSDHVLPRPWLGRVVGDANRSQDTYELEIRSLADHLAEASAEASVTDLAGWSGELRSGARANLLMGVASNRVDVKIAAARAERTLERVAEPLSALFLEPSAWPRSLLDLAWRSVVVNSAHDSICACSADAVVDAVLHRYSEATDIGAGLTERALRTIGERAGARGALIVNPSAHTRQGIVELDLPGEGDSPDLQVLEQRPAQLALHTIRATEAPTIVERELDIRPDLVAVELTGPTADGPAVVTLEGGDRLLEAPPARARAVVEQLERLASDAPGAEVRVDLHRPAQRRALAATGPVPGFAWRAWRAGVDGPTVTAREADTGATLEGDGLTVRVSGEDGTWSINGVAGLGRLVDGGDAGDTYNHSPPRRDLVVDSPDEVAVQVVEAGPLRAAVEVLSRYRWPERIERGGRTGSVEHRVTTRLELRAGEPFVRVTTTFDNRSRDHRLRAWFPLPRPTDHSAAECAFGTVTRGLTAEGGPTEAGLPTFPSRRFVSAGALTVAHEGLLEYELVDPGATGGDGDPGADDPPSARALALTLLRATGMLSRGPMANRPLPAGPEDSLEGPQLQGRVSVRYVVALDHPDPYRLAEEAFVPLLVTNGDGAPGGPHREQALEIAGAVVSAVERRGETLHVRVFNPDPEPTVVTVPGRRGWRLDLAERPLEPFEDRLVLEGHRIATLALDEAEGGPPLR